LAVLIGRIVVYCGCYRRRHEADDVYLPSSECNSPRDNYRVATALTRVIHSPSCNRAHAHAFRFGSYTRANRYRRRDMCGRNWLKLVTTLFSLLSVPAIAPLIAAEERFFTNALVL